MHRNAIPREQVLTKIDLCSAEQIYCLLGHRLAVMCGVGSNRDRSCKPQVLAVAFRPLGGGDDKVARDRIAEHVAWRIPL